MRTVYTVHNHGVDWEGDCAQWAAEARDLGLTVTETRVLWVGKAHTCIGCILGHH